MGVLAIEICEAVGTQSKFWRVVNGKDVLARSETMYNKTDAVVTATHFKENTAAYKFEVIRTRNVPIHLALDPGRPDRDCLHGHVLAVRRRGSGQGVCPVERGECAHRRPDGDHRQPLVI